MFVHGLRGHPRKTWKSAPAATERSSDPAKKRKGFKSLFKRKSTDPSATEDQAEASASQAPNVFWPEEFLASDIPQAQVWTYGYNADVIGDFFQANNKNSISQHGRDLSVRLERVFEDDRPIAFVAHSLGGIIVKDVSPLFAFPVLSHVSL